MRFRVKKKTPANVSGALNKYHTKHPPACGQAIYYDMLSVISLGLLQERLWLLILLLKRFPMWAFLQERRTRESP